MNIFSIVFPGQGYHKKKILLDLKKKYKIVQDTFDEASTFLGYDLWKIININTDKFYYTYKSQIALLVSSISIWKLWKDIIGIKPNVIAGHSFGEYSCLICSGILKFNEVIRLVEQRGKIIKKFFPYKKGLMAAIIGTNKNNVYDLCKKASQGEILFPAIFNNKNQTIISGNKNAVKRAIFISYKFGAKKSFLLPICYPFHSYLMKPISKKLSKILDKLNLINPKIPFVNNISFSCEKNINIIKKSLIYQLYKPLNWINIIKYISKIGVKIILEFGPGNILTKINKNIVKNIECISVNNCLSFKKACKKLNKDI
ncbi:MAG: ACP S-malonyltransferase [Enterobacterales bacterium]